MKTIIIASLLLVATFRCDKHSTAFASADTEHKFKVGDCVVSSEEDDLPEDYRISVQKIKMVTAHHYLTLSYSDNHWRDYKHNPPIVFIDKFYTKLECPK